MFLTVWCSCRWYNNWSLEIWWPFTNRLLMTASELESGYLSSYSVDFFPFLLWIHRHKVDAVLCFASIYVHYFPLSARTLPLLNYFSRTSSFLMQLRKIRVNLFLPLLPSWILVCKTQNNLSSLPGVGLTSRFSLIITQHILTQRTVRHTWEGRSLVLPQPEWGSKWPQLLFQPIPWSSTETNLRN